MVKKTNSLVKLLLFIFTVTLFQSCTSPKSKEAYIEGFEKFVKRVEKNHDKYNKKDWKWADAQFEKYNNKWYLNYKGDYTLQDQIKIKTLILKYNACKKDEDFGKIINELFEKDVEKFKGKVDDYVEKDMEKIIESAAEIGDSAIKVLEDIIEKIDKSF